MLERAAEFRQMAKSTSQGTLYAFASGDRVWLKAARYSTVFRVARRNAATDWVV